MFKPRKILVPTDFSEHSDKALQKALDIAQQGEAEITLLHVIPHDIQTFMGYHGFITDELDSFEKVLLETGEKNLKKQIDKFPEFGKVKVASVVRRGVTYVEILNYQSEMGIDLIVIGSHGRSKIAEHFMIGSVATKVVNAAQCEVLIVKD